MAKRRTPKRRTHRRRSGSRRSGGLLGKLDIKTSATTLLAGAAGYVGANKLYKMVKEKNGIAMAIGACAAVAVAAPIVIKDPLIAHGVIAGAAVPLAYGVVQMSTNSEQAVNLFELGGDDYIEIPLNTPADFAAVAQANGMALPVPQMSGGVGDPLYGGVGDPLYGEPFGSVADPSRGLYPYAA